MSGVTPEQLRALAELLEQHPELPRPHLPGAGIGTTRFSDDEADAALDEVARVLGDAGIEYTDRRNQHGRTIDAPDLMQWTRVWSRHMAAYEAALSYDGSVQP